MFLQSLFGKSVSDEVVELLNGLLGSMEEIMAVDNVRDFINILIGAAVALLVIYFFMDMASKASMNLISSEGIILACIKLCLGISILIYLPDLIHWLFELAKALYETMASVDIGLSSGGLQYPDGWLYGYDSFEELEAAGGEAQLGEDLGVTFFIENIGPLIMALLTSIIVLFVNVAAYLIAISNCIILIIRAMFSPIAVVQCFDNGAQSAGVQYLKKFLSTGFHFAIIIVALRASEMLCDGMMVSRVREIGQVTNCIDLMRLCSINGLVSVVASKVAALGAMFMGGKVADDIVGVR